MSRRHGDVLLRPLALDLVPLALDVARVLGRDLDLLGDVGIGGRHARRPSSGYSAW